MFKNKLKNNIITIASYITIYLYLLYLLSYLVLCYLSESMELPVAPMDLPLAASAHIHDPDIVHSVVVHCLGAQNMGRQGRSERVGFGEVCRLRVQGGRARAGKNVPETCLDTRGPHAFAGAF